MRITWSYGIFRRQILETRSKKKQKILIVLLETVKVFVWNCFKNVSENHYDDFSIHEKTIESFSQHFTLELEQILLK